MVGDFQCPLPRGPGLGRLQAAPRFTGTHPRRCGLGPHSSLPPTWLVFQPSSSRWPLHPPDGDPAKDPERGPGAC